MRFFSLPTSFRKQMLIHICLLSFAITGSIVVAEKGSRGAYGNNPSEVLDRVVGEANKDIQFQETALDGITDTQGGYQKEYKISNTLDYIRVNVAPYIQWMVYIGLTLAVILLIYNGFLMVTNAVGQAGDMTKIKNNLKYIAIGVVLITGFYAIIKIAIGLINSLFGTNSTTDTGF